jgi:hypothetical protein
MSSSGGERPTPPRPDRAHHGPTWPADGVTLRQMHFDSWAASAGAPDDSDSTPESLDTLGRLLRERLASVDDLKTVWDRFEEFD